MKIPLHHDSQNRRKPGDLASPMTSADAHLPSPSMSRRTAKTSEPTCAITSRSRWTRDDSSDGIHSRLCPNLFAAFSQEVSGRVCRRQVRPWLAISVFHFGWLDRSWVAHRFAHVRILTSRTPLHCRSLQDRVTFAFFSFVLQIGRRPSTSPMNPKPNSTVLEARRSDRQRKSRYISCVNKALLSVRIS